MQHPQQNLCSLTERWRGKRSQEATKRQDKCADTNEVGSLSFNQAEMINRMKLYQLFEVLTVNTVQRYAWEVCAAHWTKIKRLLMQYSRSNKNTLYFPITNFLSVFQHCNCKIYPITCVRFNYNLQYYHFTPSFTAGCSLPNRLFLQFPFRKIY